MLRAAAILLLVLWLIGSVSGYPLGGVIHVLLLAATLLYVIHRRIESKSAAQMEVSPASILSIVLRNARREPGEDVGDRGSVRSR